MSDPVAEHLSLHRSGTLANSLRIPIIDDLLPDQSYVLCVVVNDPAWGGLMPTENELMSLNRYLKYLHTKFWVWPSPELPYDIDRGINTLVFLKRAIGDWSYRHLTWTQDPILWPSLLWDQRYELEELLNKIENMNSDWTDWLAAHPA